MTPAPPSASLRRRVYPNPDPPRKLATDPSGALLFWLRVISLALPLSCSWIAGSGKAGRGMRSRGRPARPRLAHKSLRGSSLRLSRLHLCAAPERTPLGSLLICSSRFGRDGSVVSLTCGTFGKLEH